MITEQRIKEIELLTTEVIRSHGAFGENEKYRKLNIIAFAKAVYEEGYQQGIDDGWTDALNRFGG